MSMCSTGRGRDEPTCSAEWDAAGNRVARETASNYGHPVESHGFAAGRSVRPGPPSDEEDGMALHVLRRATLLAAVAALIAVSGGVAAGASTGWSMGGHDLSNTRSNSDQKAITADNAGKLATKWTFATHGDVSATPAVVGGAVYFPDWGGYINKVSASTGTLIWQRKLADYDNNFPSDLVSRTAPAVVGNVLYIGDQAGGSNVAPQPGHAMAIDASKGDLLWGTQINTSCFQIITPASGGPNAVVY